MPADPAATPPGKTRHSKPAATISKSVPRPATDVKPRVSLRAIAEQAGVTRMTVSLALRDSPAISEKTRTRVQATARRLGYVPDPVVADLLSKLRRATRVQNIATLGIVTNTFHGLSWRDIATHRAYFEGAKERAESLGYSFEEFRLHHEGMNEQRATNIMWSRGIEGAVIFPTLNRSGAFHFPADLSRLSVATIAYSLQSPRLNRSCVHHFRVVMEACQQLYALGYRRLGLALDENQDRRSGHNWRAGFLAAEHIQNGAAALPPLIPHHLDYAKFSRWFGTYRPDAILHLPDANDGVAPIFGWLKRCGVRVPDDVGYVCLDLTPSMAEISGMEQQSKIVGATAIDLVIAGLLQHERGVPTHVKTTMVDGVWRESTTTRRLT